MTTLAALKRRADDVERRLPEPTAAHDDDYDLDLSRLPVWLFLIWRPLTWCSERRENTPEEYLAFFRDLVAQPTPEAALEFLLSWADEAFCSSGSRCHAHNLKRIDWTQPSRRRFLMEAFVVDNARRKTEWHRTRFQHRRPGPHFPEGHQDDAAAMLLRELREDFASGAIRSHFWERARVPKETSS